LGAPIPVKQIHRHISKDILRINYGQRLFEFKGIEDRRLSIDQTNIP